MAGRVAGKVALITGGARGMGAAHARRLVAEGAQVVIADILDAQGAALAAELGPAARYVHLDVTNSQEWTAGVGAAVESFGGLHVLVNNAGVFGGASIIDHPLDLWDRFIAVNLTGTFLGIRAATPAMIASSGTSIINISSVAGLRGAGFGHAYVASKFGVRGLTKSVAIELAPHGIRCNSVHPGIIDTPIWTKIDQEGVLAAGIGLPSGSNAIDPNMIAMATPLGFPGSPFDIADGIVFLASDESRYMTGSELVIDGGMRAR
jgi:3alpha(or 20beta)-hydroxysteroid dehydrogenase